MVGSCVFAPEQPFVVLMDAFASRWLEKSVLFIISLASRDKITNQACKYDAGGNGFKSRHSSPGGLFLNAATLCVSFPPTIYIPTLLAKPFLIYIGITLIHATFLLTLLFQHSFASVSLGVK